jgi:glycine/betaine/sarcosine/D-proline reductase family selenoprotein B
MAKELERAGFPTATVTSLAAVAVKVGANRIVRGNRFSHPCGRPGLPLAEERAWRVELVRTALRALATPVEGPTIFEPAGS